MTIMKWIKGVVCAGLLAVGAGCATTPSDVFKAADTDAQRAYAVYGTFTVLEEQAAALVEDPAVKPEIKRAIAAADARAKPIVDAMLDTAKVYDDIKEDVQKGVKDKTLLYTVASSLSAWLKNAIPAVENLASAIKGAK